jgi:mannitol/fructose-specific phosphotransferase system IIA component (Ntr-type)
MLVDCVDHLLMLGVNAATRGEAIHAILEDLVERSILSFENVPALESAIIGRDELGPTGIGEGIAIPHACHSGLDRVVVALAVSRDGIDYPSLDGEPVHVILLILTPPYREFEPTKQAIFETWLRHFREPAFRASLRLSRNSEELREAIRRADPPPC